ncbi:MAG: WYL domain-containing protein, partial [Clostridia bacterium]|nr:WYL domain-containing protein [Clostridia bacterium]
MILLNNKKMSTLCILNILREFSDENNPLTQADIINKIYANYGLELERKSISSTLDSLRDFGFDIIKTSTGCYLGEREFEPSEISFLIDAVFSSKSLDSKRSRELAEKLSKFLSHNQRKKFKYICKSDEIVRTDNKQLFYTIDILHDAIEQGKQVEFNYNRFYFNKDTQDKKKQKRYIINPYFMINNQGKYYLVCNHDYFNEIANYKIELISNIKILDNPIKPITKLKGCEQGVDMAKYANENIYM